MSDHEQSDEESEIIQHNGEDLVNMDYETRMKLEDVFRVNHLDIMQDLYDNLRPYFEAKNIDLQDFIDFCMENSYVEEEIICI